MSECRKLKIQMEKICEEIKSLDKVSTETVALAIEFLKRLQPDPLPRCKGASFGVVILEWPGGQWGNLICQINSTDKLPSVGVSVNKSDFQSLDFETEQEKKHVLKFVTARLRHVQRLQQLGQWCEEMQVTCAPTNTAKMAAFRLAEEMAGRIDILPQCSRNPNGDSGVVLRWTNDETKQELVCAIDSNGSMQGYKLQTVNDFCKDVNQTRNMKLATELQALLDTKYSRPDLSVGVYGAARLSWSNGDTKVICFVDSENNSPTAELVFLYPDRNTEFVNNSFDTEENKKEAVGALAKALGMLFK